MSVTIKENPPVRGNVQEDGRGIEFDIVNQFNNA